MGLLDAKTPVCASGPVEEANRPETSAVPSRYSRHYYDLYLMSQNAVVKGRALAVSRDDDWSGWCIFFLEALRSQAEQNLNKANAILELYNRMKLKIAQISHSQFSMHALEWIFEQPIFNSTDFIKASGIPKPTATRILRILREEDILQVWQQARGSKPAVYGYGDLLNVAEGYQAF